VLTRLIGPYNVVCPIILHMPAMGRKVCKMRREIKPCGVDQDHEDYLYHYTDGKTVLSVRVSRPTPGRSTMTLRLEDLSTMKVLGQQEVGNQSFIPVVAKRMVSKWFEDGDEYLRLQEKIESAVNRQLERFIDRHPESVIRG